MVQYFNIFNENDEIYDAVKLHGYQLVLFIYKTGIFFVKQTYERIVSEDKKDEYGNWKTS